MKVLLTAYSPFIYLHKEILLSVICGLKPYSAELYFLPTDVYSGQVVHLPGAKRLPLLQGLVPHSWGKVCSVFRLVKCVINKHIIRWLLWRNRPDIVIIPSSDLADFDIRVLQDQCQRLRIPVLIIITVNSLSNIPKRQIKWGRFSTKLIKMLGVEKAVSFNGTVVGSYLENSSLAVPGTFTKDQLVHAGIHPDRVTVTGNPAHDELVRLRNNSVSNITDSLPSGLQDKLDKQNAILYCTELIDLIYDEQYFIQVNKRLKEIFDELPDSITVIIKLHPRESVKNKAHLLNLFQGDQYTVLETADIHALLKAAHFLVCHFSATIIESIIIGTPIIRIDVKNDRRYAELFPDGDLVVAKSFNDLHTKITDMISDDRYRANVSCYLENWIKKYAAYRDGHSTERIVALIQAIVNKS